MPLIKRYPNRKLYDLDAKQYVTLETIAQIIREGQDVQVVDHETGDDLTNLTLSQIIFEQEKKKTGFLPRSILTSLIRTGGDTLDYLRRTLQSGVLTEHQNSPPAHTNQTDPSHEMTGQLQQLVAAGRLTAGEANGLQAGFDSIKNQKPEDLGLLALLDEQLVGVLHRLNIPTYNELHALQEQLSELTGKLESVLEEVDQEAPLAKPSAKPSGKPSGKAAKPDKAPKR